MHIRPALPADTPALEALLAPEIAAGTVLPRAVRAEEFLVAELDGEPVGAVALSPLGPGAVELGSLVAARRGLGLGRALVEAAVARAEAEGHPLVVALTGVPDFFARCGFDAVADSPWLRARRAGGHAAPIPLPAPADVARASAAKAGTCASCARLVACRQVLLARRTRAVAAGRVA